MYPTYRIYCIRIDPAFGPLVFTLAIGSSVSFSMLQLRGNRYVEFAFLAFPYTSFDLHYRDVSILIYNCRKICEELSHV